MCSWRVALCWVILLAVLVSAASVGHARILYVDDDAPGAGNGTSWRDACWCLQDALTVAQNGDEIRIAAGTYKPDQHGVSGGRPGRRIESSGDREALFALKNGLTLRGGYAGFGQPDPDARDVDAYKSILSGDLAGNDAEVADACDLLAEPTLADNCNAVVVALGITSTAVLDGLVVTGSATRDNRDGGGLVAMDSRVNVVACTFIRNSTSRNGGGVWVRRAVSQQITNCVFVENGCGVEGGGLGVRDSTLTVTDCTFQRNWAKARGGAIGFSNSNAMLTNCTFVENSAVEAGGAIRNGGMATLVGCLFSGNTSVGDGGAVYIRGGNMDFSRCVFRGNTTQTRGGAVVATYSSGATYQDCGFDGNQAGNGGGGALCFVNESADNIVTNCSFTGNVSTGSGGGICLYGDSQNVVLTDCTFTKNSAGSGGGMAGGAQMRLTNCRFVENKGTVSGGALCAGSAFPIVAIAMYGMPTITNCTFSRNSAPQGGGLLATNCRLVNCQFDGNRADYGGGAYTGQTINSLWTDCTFTGNSATRSGGGLHSVYGERPTFRRCTFRNNVAHDYGGAVNDELWGATYAQCTFINNAASFGGAVSVREDCSPQLTHCLLAGNRASESGGGYDGGKASVLTNCAFVGNTAPRGGGMANRVGAPLLTNCTIVANASTDVPGGIWSEGVLTLTNCIVWGNRDGFGQSSLATQIFGESAVLNRCCVQGWTVGRDNLGADPLFVRSPSDGGDGWGDNQATLFVDEGANDDFGVLWLGAQSPCIDAGDVGALTADALDLDGDGNKQEPIPVDLDGARRVVGAGVDIGAYEYHGVLPLHVDADAPGANNGANWYNAYRSLQDALACAKGAVKPVEIRVAQGVYRPDRGGSQTPGARDASFQLINWVTIKGGYAGHGALDPNACDPRAYEAVLSGDLAGDDAAVTDPCALFTERTRADNSFHVVTGAGTDSTAVLEGVVVTAGHANGAGVHRQGGGLHVKGGHPTVRDCVLRFNLGYTGAGLYSEGGSPSLRACSFLGNGAHEQGGALAVWGGRPTLTDCKVHNNVARRDGGGVLCTDGTPMFTRCTFSANRADNRGGAIYSYESDPRLIDCKFRSDSATLGGGVFTHRSEPVFANCVFQQCRATQGAGLFSQRLSVISMANCFFSSNCAVERGGGVYSQASDVRLSNCTLTQNVAQWQGGGIYLANTDMALSNCIVWGNTAKTDAEVASDESTVDLEVTSCNVREGRDLTVRRSDRPGSGGADIFDAEPALTPDGHLTGGSGCIDAGSATALPNDELDLDGDLDTREPLPQDMDAGPRGFDDPDVPDTGAGVPPVVDIGSDEFIDSDRDGLPDWWERKYLGHAVSAAPDDDPDGDMLTNRQEYELFSSDPMASPVHVNAAQAAGADADGTAARPYATIQQGLDAARDGDTVLVAAGTYRGPGNRDMSFRGKAVVLCSLEGAAATVIDCEGKGRGFEFRSGEAAGTALVGFTITNGRADGGGAIRCDRAGPQIVECVITGCSDPAGYADGVYGYLSSPTFADCVIGANGSTSVSLEYGVARVRGVVELRADRWAGAGTMFCGPGLLSLEEQAAFSLKDSAIRCNLEGTGIVEVPLGSELRVEGVADVNLAGDPNNGRIRCEGLLRVRDAARVRNAAILVTRASFEDDAIVSNSVINAEAGSPYGQFFVEDTAHILANDIHADGDRYMDLEPSVFQGLIENNRIYVTITEGQDRTRGGLLELRGQDLYNAACGLDVFLCPLTGVPSFDTRTWTIERLELLPGAKVNLTNRFDFGNGGHNEVMYVKDLVLGAGSVLNTGFNRLYYQSLAAAETARIENVPILGFSLNMIAFNDAEEFFTRVLTNNFEHPAHGGYGRRHVERVVDLAPDPKGMMRMRNLADGDPQSVTYGEVFRARAKGLFAKAGERRILVFFQYLFESGGAGTELAVYLSDVPELLDHESTRRAAHYVEVARVAAPPAGQPGAAGSGRFGTFHAYVDREHLEFIRGTRIELELIGPKGTSVLIDDWDPQVHCSDQEGICMDLDWSDTTDEEDFLIVLREYGSAAGLTADGTNSRACLEGAFSRDGYIDAEDIHAWDWVLNGGKRTNLCSGLPLMTNSGGISAFAGASLHASSSLHAAADASVLSDLLILGKRSNSADLAARKLKDRLYCFARDGSFMGSPGLDRDRCNLRLVRGLDGGLYRVNSETGVTRLRPDGLDEPVIPPGETPVANEPRYGGSARVFIGVQETGAGLFGRPIFDAAVDRDGSVYVVPVVVAPAGRRPYVAAAKLLRAAGNPPYVVGRIYDHPPVAGDNGYGDHQREIEIDGNGNVYVLNVHSLNESDALLRHDSGGAVQRLGLGDRRQDLCIPDPVALHVSEAAGLVYLASGQADPQGAGWAVIHGLSTQDLSRRRSIVVQGMRHVVGVAEEPGTGRLYVLGFSMIDPIPENPSGLAAPFYYPCLATIGPDGDDAAVAVLAGSGDHDLALPTGIVWTGGGP